MLTTIRRGFTLIELLVVIAIIGVLVAMLLPAIQSAREASRRAQCASNLKQLSLGLIAYHNLNNTFPPSSTWPGVVKSDYSVISVPGYSSIGPNWAVLILPQLDQQTLYQSFAITPGAGNIIPQNAVGVATPLSVMTCPTDTYGRTAFTGPSASGPTQPWARGNYGAVGGLCSLASSALGQPGWSDVNASNCAYNQKGQFSGNRFMGVMGLDCALTLDQIKDGASNTMLLAELRAGLNNSDPRGVWALGGISSSVWGHGLQGVDNGPNCGGYGDQMPGCAQIQSQFTGGSAAMIQLGMPCTQSQIPLQTARSMHFGGIQAAFCDGSVHFIADHIQTVNLSSFDVAGASACAVALSAWDMLNLSNDAHVIPAGAY